MNGYTFKGIPWFEKNRAFHGIPGLGVVDRLLTSKCGAQKRRGGTRRGVRLNAIFAQPGGHFVPKKSAQQRVHGSSQASTFQGSHLSHCVQPVATAEPVLSGPQETGRAHQMVTIPLASCSGGFALRLIFGTAIVPTVLGWFYDVFGMVIMNWPII